MLVYQQICRSCLNMSHLLIIKLSRFTCTSDIHLPLKFSFYSLSVFWLYYVDLIQYYLILCNKFKMSSDIWHSHSILLILWKIHGLFTLYYSMLIFRFEILQRIRLPHKTNIKQKPHPITNFITNSKDTYNLRAR